MTMLGMPAVPAAAPQRSAGPVGFTAGHHFAVTGDASVEELAAAATAPLSVILQVTKRCNFDCSFCSETLQLPDPTLTDLDTMRGNLAGVQRVFLSGGEPLMRRDFGDIVDMYTGDFILGIPTNATRGLQHAKNLVGKVGRHWDMLAALAIDWADRPDAEAIPIAAATVYLRVRRHGSAYEIGADTLSIGFRATVLDDPAEVPDLLRVVDRALTRARRHAAILAGHDLDTDLTQMMTLSETPLRGTVGVAEAWTDRTTKGRGLALMVDTDAEASATGAALDIPVAGPWMPPILDGPICTTMAARAVLARALAIGLTAAVHAGRYHWEGTFPVGAALDRAAWDVLGADAPDAAAGTALDTTGRPDTPAYP